MVEPSSRLAGAARDFLALGVGNYGAMAVGLAINMLLARRLGTDGYGRLALMLMASQVLLLVAVSWTNAGFVRFASREHAARCTVAETLWARLSILVPAAAAGVLVVLAVQRPLAAYLEIPQAAVWLIVLHFSAASALSVIGAVFQASERMAHYGACLFLDKAAMLLCILLFPAAWTHNPMVVVGCYAASSLLVAMWGVSVVGLTAIRPTMATRSAYRELILFSVPLLFSTWAGFFGANWFDLAILKWYVPLSGVGVYSLGAQLAGVAQQLAIIFSTLVFPSLSVMVAEGQDVRIRTLAERLLPYWLLGTAVLFTVVIICAREGIPLMFGRAFSGTAPILALLMVATWALTLFTACAPVVAAYGSMWVLSGITLASAVANVMLDLVLIPPLGGAGSALATVLAYGLSALLVLVFLQRRIGGRLLRLGWVGAPVVVGCVSFVVLEGPWFYATAVGAAFITVAVLVGAFRLFHTDDAVFFRDLRLPLPFWRGAGLAAGRRSS
ncbi:MAG: oligosaccharide flippase family protein [Acidobacteriota bacterium]